MRAGRGFLLGQAMERWRTPLLVVDSDYEKGGTWTGAVEQLEKLKFVPVFVRFEGKTGKGLDGLLQRGAKPWPNPKTQDALEKLLSALPVAHRDASDQRSLTLGVRDELAPLDGARKVESSAGESTFERPLDGQLDAC